MVKCKTFMLIIVSVMFFAFSSCVSEKNSNTNDLSVRNIVTAISFDEIDSNLDRIAYYDDELFKSNFEKLYDIEYNSISDGAIIYCSDSGCANEISILKGDKPDEIKNSLENRVKSRLKTFQGYSPTEAEKIDNYRILEYANCVFLIISEKSQEIEEKIKRIL